MNSESGDRRYRVQRRRFDAAFEGSEDNVVGGISRYKTVDAAKRAAGQDRQADIHNAHRLQYQVVDSRNGDVVAESALSGGWRMQWMNRVVG